MARTDFTQEIDGALAGRNLGSRHYSEIARSGNGNMRTDLAEDLADHQELAGLGEATEELTLAESAAVDQQGTSAAIAPYRWPKSGEVPPFASNPGMVWLRKRTLTTERKPGGLRLARNIWVQVSKDRLIMMKRGGELQGLGFDMSSLTSLPMIASVGIGLVGGLVIWLVIKRKKKA
jgi:hypothetical protein